MLLQLVQQTVAQIILLDRKSSVPQFAQQIRDTAPDTIERLLAERKRGGTRSTAKEAANALADSALICVKAIPQVVGQLTQRLEDKRLPAHRRAAIASILEYLVQPHDFIPDDAPGGYGYLDDAILLRAGVVEYLDTLPNGSKSAESESNIVGLLISLAPEDIREEIEEATTNVSRIVQFSNASAQQDASNLLAQFLQNPMAAFAKMAPAFAAAPAFGAFNQRNFQQGFWGKSGAYIEGDNFILPGGGGLINGEVFIP